MKRVFFTIMMIVACMSSIMADEVYYYSAVGKVYMNTDSGKVTVTFDNEDGFSFDNKFLVAYDKQYSAYAFDVDSEEYNYIVDNDLRRIEGPVLVVDEEKRELDVYIGAYFNVGLKDANDTAALDEWIEKLNLNVICQNTYMPYVWTLTVTPETGYNALEIANMMYESGDFKWCEPELINSIHLAVPTGIENLTTDDEVKAYYDLQGRKVGNPSYGIYIERSGDKARKVIISK